MANTDLELFMEKLKQLIDDDSNQFTSNLYIRRKLPEIELLHEELGHLIGSGLKDMTLDDEQLRLHELHYLGNWKKRVIDIVYEAEEIVDMFISSAVLNTDLSFLGSRNPECSLQLNHIMDEIRSIRKEMSDKKWKSEFESSININRLVRKDIKLGTQAAGASSNRNPARVVNPSATNHEEIVVGLDEDARSIMDRLAGDRKQLDIISIVGMGGLGKTTLATKIYNDRYVAHHFYIRGWITVSQAYTRRVLLKGILESIGKSVHEATTEPTLREMLYKSLKGKRYLVVIDDIWSVEALNDLRRFLPDDNTASRILLTTRLTEVASLVSPGGLTHNLQCLTEEESWKLLCRKAFRGYECPESLIEMGKHIAIECRGLPLALVVIAGLLEKGEKNISLWMKVAGRVSSYVINDPSGCLDTLSLSYEHLPHHLRKCLLYVGGFPEDYKIQVKRLIRLWMAEGFIVEAGQRSLEEQAECYLMDLVDRNLLIVADRRSDGGIKSCRLHDLLREVCMRKATEEKFFLKIGKSSSNPFYDSDYSLENERRLFTDDLLPYNGSITHVRSVLCFSYGYSSSLWVGSFLLLKVLDMLEHEVCILSEIKILVHLRYLAVWTDNQDLSAVVGRLWRLQTLLVKGMRLGSLFPVGKTTKMVNLRHLWCDKLVSIGPGCPVLFNLQSISCLKLDRDQLLRSFPNIKKLACSVSADWFTGESPNFAFLTHLESLNIENRMYDKLHLEHPIRFPETLKRLSLKQLHLSWSCMSMIQQLPNLEVLKLLHSSFKGRVWSTGDEQFRQLKFLKLHKLEIETWEASSINFPRLEKLVIGACHKLKGIPLEIGDVSTLEHIEISPSNSRLVQSVERIQEEQHALGNNDIHVKFLVIRPDDFLDEDTFCNYLLPYAAKMY